MWPLTEIAMILSITSLYKASGGAVAGPQTRAAEFSQEPSLNFNHSVGHAFSHLARTAYCGPMDKMSDWSCEPCRASGVRIRNGTWRYVHHAQEEQRNATYVLVAQLAGPAPFTSGCLVSIRGTELRGNMQRDLRAGGVSLPMDWNCTGCKVAQGWYRTWNNVEDAVLSQLSSIGCAPGSKTELFVTGHSMGAAVSTLAIYSLTQRYNYVVRMAYVFASPRVGNKAFAQAFNEKVGTTTNFFRVSYHRDFVVHLPPMFMGYVHVQSEVFYDKPGGEARMCTSVEDSSCANQYWRYNVEDHCASPFSADESLCACPGWIRGVRSPDHADVASVYI